MPKEIDEYVASEHDEAPDAEYKRGEADAADPGEDYPGDATATDTNTEGGHP